MKIENIDFTAFNALDIGVFFVIVVSMLFAFMRGFIGSLLSLTGWILAILLSYQLFPYARPYLLLYIKSELLVILVGHALLLLFLLVIFAIFNTMIATFMIAMQRGFFDRILGCIFGFFRGGLIVSFFFLCFSMIVNLVAGNKPISEKDDAMPEIVRKAQLYPFLKSSGHILIGFLPVSIEDSLKFIANNFGEKTLDERFVAASIRKLYQYLDAKELDEMEQRSENTDDLSTLRELKEIYLEKLHKGQITEDAIPEEDLFRMDAALNSRE